MTQKTCFLIYNLVQSIGGAEVWHGPKSTQKHRSTESYIILTERYQENEFQRERNHKVALGPEIQVDPIFQIIYIPRQTMNQVRAVGPGE